MLTWSFRTSLCAKISYLGCWLPSCYTLSKKKHIPLPLPTPFPSPLSALFLHQLNIINYIPVATSYFNLYTVLSVVIIMSNTSFCHIGQTQPDAFMRDIKVSIYHGFRDIYTVSENYAWKGVRIKYCRWGLGTDVQTPFLFCSLANHTPRSRKKGVWTT